MAVQLLNAGEAVQLVVLLDAATPQAAKRPTPTARQRFGNLARTLADARRRDGARDRRAYPVAGLAARKLAAALVREITRPTQQWWVRMRFRLLHQVLTRQLSWPRWIRELTPLQVCETSGTYYLPTPLREVPVILVCARRRSVDPSDTPFRTIYADPKLGWGAVTEGPVVLDADGGHVTMLQEPFVEALATSLCTYLNHESQLVARAR
jgi:thioesterase domain-containing protein